MARPYSPTSANITTINNKMFQGKSKRGIPRMGNTITTKAGRKLTMDNCDVSRKPLTRTDINTVNSIPSNAKSGTNIIMMRNAKLGIIKI